MEGFLQVMRAIIFGLGRAYNNNKQQIDNFIDVVAYSDNNSDLWGTHIDGINVIRPDEITKYFYDTVLVTSSGYYQEIKKQLRDFGIPSEKIFEYQYYALRLIRGKIKYCGDYSIKKNKKNILIMSTDLNYDGGSLAAVYAAYALKQKGIHVLLEVPSANENLVNEIIHNNIPVAIAPAMLNPGRDEVKLVDDYEMVIINVYQNIVPVYIYCKKKPILWWIHERNKLIEVTNLKYSGYAANLDFNKILCKAVCHNVKDILQRMWSDIEIGIMPYGIPDFYKGETITDNHKKMAFVVIGTIQKRKGQDIFANAALIYNKICNISAEFLIIGENIDKKYYLSIKEMADKADNICIKGLFTREMLENIYPSIDVIVCPSRHEGLPIVVNEGLMNKKVCIVADTAGDNDKIIDGDNGFFFHGEDVEELAQKMKYVAEHYNELGVLRDNARKTYLENYTLEAFGDRLEQAIDETIRNYTND